MAASPRSFPPLSALLAVLFAAGPVAAQAHAHGPAGANPYADLLDRSIKALSDEEVEQLRSGEGMGLALAAELNGLPGPRHVLELAGDLELDGDTRAAVQEVFDAMRARAVELGTAVVDQERTMDRAFASGAVTPESVREATARIAELRGALRAVHLEAHLRTVELLSTEQLHRYTMLRGYHGSER